MERHDHSTLKQADTHNVCRACRTCTYVCRIKAASSRSNVIASHYFSVPRMLPFTSIRAGTKTMICEAGSDRNLLAPGFQHAILVGAMWRKRPTTVSAQIAHVQTHVTHSYTFLHILTQKGLRDRNSPYCTLSQNGYGDSSRSQYIRELTKASLSFPEGAPDTSEDKASMIAPDSLTSR